MASIQGDMYFFGMRPFSQGPRDDDDDALFKL